MTPNGKPAPEAFSMITDGDERGFDLAEMALRDLERKRADIEAAIRALLTARPDLRRRSPHIAPAKRRVL